MKKPAKKPAAKAKPAAKPARKKSKQPTWAEMNRSYQMLEEFSIFLDDARTYRRGPEYSRKLIKQITEEWSSAAAKDSAQKHKAALIKGFGEYVASK